MPPNQAAYCTITITLLWMTSLSSTLLVLSMTFERFYSIIRPHKAASLNTIERAKTIILCTGIVSVAYNLPHIYITTSEGRRCGAFGKAMKTGIGKFYYKFSAVINFILPFILLLIMNCYIFHTVRRRPNLTSSRPVITGQGQNQGQPHKIKNTEMQIFIILLLVAFGFLFLTTPAYAFFFYINIADYKTTPKVYAGYLLFHSLGQKLHYTNFGINFYLYVISGQKFRNDLLKLFKIRGKESRGHTCIENNTSTSITSVAVFKAE